MVKDISLSMIKIDPYGDEDFDIVGISMMTAQAPRGYEIAKLYKKKGKYIQKYGFTYQSS